MWSSAPTGKRERYRVGQGSNELLKATVRIAQDDRKNEGDPSTRYHSLRMTGKTEGRNDTGWGRAVTNF